MGDASPLGSLFMGVAAASSALLLSVTAALYSVAHTSGARYGVGVRTLAGARGTVFFGWTVLLLAAALVLAAVGSRPNLESFLSVHLPIASATLRPETAMFLAAALAVSLVLALWTLFRVIRMTAPASVGIEATKQASLNDFLDSLHARWGLSEPPAVDWVEGELRLRALGAGGDGPTAEEIGRERGRRERLWAHYRETTLRLERGLERGTIRNPLAPAINALHVLIDQRNTESFAATWRTVLRRVEKWRATDAEAARICTRWVWQEMEELARHALSSHFTGACLVTVKEMQPWLRSALSDGGKSALHMSRVAIVALGAGDDEVVDAIVQQYAAAARDGLERDDRALFEYACLGIGHLGEVAVRRPRQPVSIIATNQSSAFANPFDVGHACASQLNELAYQYREKGLHRYPLFLRDALAVVLRASVESGLAARGETALKCVHGMGEMVGAAVKKGDREELGYAAHELKEAAERLVATSFDDTTLKQVWESLAWDVVAGMAAFRGEQHGGFFDPCNSLIKVVAAMPQELRAIVGEIAWRSFLDRGESVLKEVRAELESELGPLPGWYG